MAVRDVAPARDQDPEPVVEQPRQVGHPQRLQPAGRELDGERDAVQPPADLGHRVGVVGVEAEAAPDGGPALGEQASRVLLVERTEVDDVLAVDGQRFAARGQHADGRGALPDRGGERRRPGR